jgi:MFS family permease
MKVVGAIRFLASGLRLPVILISAIGQLPARLLRPSLATVEDRNAWNLFIEIFWAAILGSAASFNATFAVRLGATNAQIGLLSSLPSLLAVLVTIPSGRFLERQAQRKGWILGTLLAHRCGYLLVALIPWLPVSDAYKGPALIALLITMGLPAHFFNIGFSALLADVVPEQRRAAIFSTRNMINSGAVSVGVFLAGQWLSHMAFPLNYQILFFSGFVTSMLSMFYLYKLDVPESPVIQPSTAAGRSLRQQWHVLRQSMREHSDFVRITVDTLIYSLGAWVASPLYILYFVRVLHASDAWIGLHATIANVAAITGYAIWRRIMARWGESKTLKRASLGVGLYPLMVGLSPALTPILFAVGLNGLISPGVGLSHINTFLKACPQARRPTYIAVYTTIVNAVAFVSPLLGVALADHFGLRPTLVGCGVFWLVGALAFRIWPVRVPDTKAM